MWTDPKPSRAARALCFAALMSLFAFASRASAGVVQLAGEDDAPVAVASPTSITSSTHVDGPIVAAPTAPTALTTVPEDSRSGWRSLLDGSSHGDAALAKVSQEV